MTVKVLIAEDARDVAEVVAFGVRMNWPGAQVMVAAGAPNRFNRSLWNHLTS